MAKGKKKQVNKQVETRMTEIRFSTSDLMEMKGKYTTGDICRKWTEDFVDNDTGQIVGVERTEKLIEGGTLIDGDLLARIQFYMVAEEITAVEVSNQRRQAFLTENTHLFPWSVTARIDGKNRRFLLYAMSVSSALEIARDYIELNFAGGFHFLNVKTFDYCVFIKNEFRKDEGAATSSEKQDIYSFYKIEVVVICENSEETRVFVLQTKDIDSAMIVINDWIAKKMEKRNKYNGTSADFATILKSGVVIPCYRIIEREFSAAYANAGDGNM